jgi:hypothetical protein
LTSKKNLPFASARAKNNFLFALKNKNPPFLFFPKMDNSDEIQRQNELVLKKARSSLEAGEITPEGLKDAIKKEKRRAKKRSGIKKAPSGYMLYSKEKRPAVAKEFEGTQIMVELAKLWKGLTQAQRDTWNAKAKNRSNKSKSSPSSKKSKKSNNPDRSPRRKKASRKTPRSKPSGTRKPRARARA